MATAQERLQRAKEREAKAREAVKRAQAQVNSSARKQRTRALIVLGAWVLAQKPELVAQAQNMMRTMPDAKGARDADALEAIVSEAIANSGR